MISIVVIAPMRFYRDGLAQIFDVRDGFSVAATAAVRDDGLTKVRAHAPDIVLLVVGPDAGAAFVRELVDAAPEARVVVLGVADEGREVLPLAEAGVAGYVTLDASADDIVDVVASVARGEMPCSPHVAAALVQRLASLAREQGRPPELEVLTAREREVVALLDEGLSNKEIAVGLSIEVTTVKNHVHNILEKLHVARRSEAAALLRRS